eukprot:s1447_g3.t1
MKTKLRRMIRQQRRKERDEDERVRRSHRLPQVKRLKGLSFAGRPHLRRLSRLSGCESMLRAAAVRGDGQYC